MNYVNYRISLDMFDTSSQITIKAKKGDSACRIIITLTKNGKIYKIGDGCYATLNGKKADGTFVYDNCTIEDNTVVYDFTSSIDENGVCQISAFEGVVECEVALFKDYKKLTSPRFNLVIDNTVYNGEEIISSPETDVLRGLINEANATIEGIKADLKDGKFKGEKGEKGDAGVCKFVVVAELPTTGIEGDAIYLVPSQDEETNNNFLEYIYVDGAWEMIGSASVKVDLTDYVKNTDYATHNKSGVVMADAYLGVQCGYASAGKLNIVKATNEEIDAKKHLYKPIVPANLEYAVKTITYDKAEIDDMVGDIETALDELHAYTQALISGGATE